MAKTTKGSNTIDETLKALYDLGKDFSDKLQVGKEMVKLEIARLKGTEGEENETPSGLKDD